MQGSLFDQEQSSFDGNLPHQSRMPLNLGRRKVYDVVVGDLCNQWDALVVTGYSGVLPDMADSAVTSHSSPSWS
ncbi:hypothetical protein OKW11_002341 [Pseudomonas baetica]|nr:hypothetical protein [Pseudomonas baetica]